LGDTALGVAELTGGEQQQCEGDQYDHGADKRRQIRVDVFDAHLGEDRRQRREYRRQQRPKLP
jgi:hypothetical protein